MSRIRRDVALDYPHRDGSVRTLHSRVAEMRDVTLEQQLEGLAGLPEVVGADPWQLRYLSSAWADIARTKVVGADQRITYPDIQAYCALNCVAFDPSEVQVIVDLDAAHSLQFAAERSKEAG